MGTTHTQYSVDSGDATALGNARNLLQAGVSYQNQHIYGWGAQNPEPSPGQYVWTDLDHRVSLMQQTGSTPIITLCCAPDWMTVPATQESTYYNVSWKRFTEAPTSDHFAAFAALAKQVAMRYSAPSNPNPVLWYDVWNELKGIPWDSTTNNWDVSYYTQMYNAVYDALKSVNPAIKVGGLYLPMEGSGTTPSQWWGVSPVSTRNAQTVQAFLAGLHGLDFLSFDRGVFDPHDTTAYSPDQAMYWSKNFEDIARQLHSLTSVPIVCAETYFYGDLNPDLQETEAGYASVLYHLLKGGASIALQWQSQGIDPANGGPANGSEFGSLFSDTRVVGGGQPYPAYYAWKAFHTYFPAGTAYYSTSSTATDLLVLASTTHALLINQAATSRTVSVNGGAPITLSPYQVLVQ